MNKEINDNVMKTGTTTLGIVFKDGVLLAADRRATAGNMIANKKAIKVVNITDKIAVTMAGTVSDAQLLINIARAELRLKQIRTGKEINVKEAANLFARMVYNNIRRMSLIPGVSHFLLGGSDSQGNHLYDIFPDGSITEVDDFVSSGSGSVFAYGVLEAGYTPDMGKDAVLSIALKALNAALQRDSASGNGIDVVLITKEGVNRVVEKNITPKVV